MFQLHVERIQDLEVCVHLSAYHSKLLYYALASIYWLVHSEVFPRSATATGLAWQMMTD